MVGKSPEKIIEIIRKILVRTEDRGCSPAEAEFAFAKAAQLLAEHNLSMDDVAVSDVKGEESWVEEELFETGRWSLEDNICYSILKNFYFVEGFFNRRAGRKVFMLFGKPENVAIARHVWAALQASFDRSWMMYRHYNDRPANEKRLYITGMADGYSAKLREEREAAAMERDMMRGSRGTALALVNISDKIVAAYKASHPNHKAGKSTLKGATGDTSTLQAGVKAGRALNINRGVSGKGQRAIN